MYANLLNDVDQPLSDGWWSAFREGRVRLSFRRYVHDDEDAELSAAPEGLSPHELTVLLETILAREAEQADDEDSDQEGDEEALGLSPFHPGMPLFHGPFPPMLPPVPGGVPPFVQLMFGGDPGGW